MATAARASLSFTGSAAGVLFRSATSGPVSAVSALSAPVDVVAMAMELGEAEFNLMERVRNRLNWLRELEGRGVRFPQRIDALHTQIWANYWDRPDRGRLRFWLEQLDFVSSYERHGRDPEWMRDFTFLLGAAEMGLSRAARAVDDFSMISPQPSSTHRVFRVVRGGPQRDGVMAQPRNGSSMSDMLTSALDDVRSSINSGFAQALAYVNQQAAARFTQSLPPSTSSSFAASSSGRSGGGGIAVAPAVPGGLLGEPIPGVGREFWLFRGEDRRLLLQTLRDLQELVKRDELAASGVKTAVISNRDPVFDTEVPGLQGAVIVTIRALKYALSLVRNRPPLTGYYSLQDEA